MERRLNILTNILLSLLIVQMSVGVTMVHCQHHSETMFAEMVSRISSDNGECHKATSNCMTKTVIKLSPSSLSKSMQYDFQPIQIVSAVIDYMLSISFEFIHISTLQIAQVMPHGPPSDYLHFIRVLRL